jgi:hypothetical protein
LKEDIIIKALPYICWAILLILEALLIKVRTFVSKGRSSVFTKNPHMIVVLLATQKWVVGVLHEMNTFQSSQAEDACMINIMTNHGTLVLEKFYDLYLYVNFDPLLWSYPPPIGNDLLKHKSIVSQEVFM